MIITKIETQKKNDSRVSVYIDGAYAFGLSAEDAVMYGLREGVELSGPELNEILAETAVSEAKEAAYRYVGYRRRTRREIETYLKRKQYPDCAVEQAIGALTEYKYIDDRELAKAFISDSLRINKWGVKKIRYELMRKGVDGATIDEAFNDSEYDAAEYITGLIIKKTRGIPPGGLDATEKRKLFGYLAGRGFTYDEIDAAYRMCAEADD